ncbi:MAG: hypothetical protein, partial [Olavius algarvensis Gamma 1 endosymbiont]
LHEQRDRRVHEATAGPVADVSPHGVSGRQRLFCWGPDGLSG